MPVDSLWLLLGIGLVAGILSGFFGIGGGVILVPALVFLVGLTQHQAIGTSLAILVVPVGLGAVLVHYSHGHVNLRIGIVIALAMLVGGVIGARLAQSVSAAWLRLGFGVFVILLGCYLVVGSCSQPTTQPNQGEAAPANPEP
jgi:hypothetical protein